jgi:lipopolysaccharide/colanic/teichoic acid biosynthesis glycosyltransferase
VLPNDITLFMDMGAAEATAETLDRLADLPLARLSGRRPGFRRILTKRAQDLVFGACALILLALPMALIALAVKLDSPGPVFFRQRRQGFNNEEFVVWKFRSMRHDQRDLRAIRQVSHGDPRITRVGQIIRRTSLDELPQLFNVLRGEMSLVGPRPHAPGMKTGDVPSAMLVGHYAHRHRMKPGMTGWAAVNGSRGPVDTPELVRQRVELDIAYIERQSFWFDLYIMAMTLPCLLGDRHVAR